MEKHPARKAFSLFVFISLGEAWSQPARPAAPGPPMPNLPDEAVVARFDDGTEFTMGDFKKYYQVLPPSNQQLALRDRAEFLHQWALFRKLAKQAEERKLADESPYKEALEYAKMQLLMQAMLNDVLNSPPVLPADILNYYDTNKE